MHDYIMQIAVWLEHRIDNAEQSDARLEELKQRVRDCSKAVYTSVGEELAPAIRAQNQAIRDLVEHVATAT